MQYKIFVVLDKQKLLSTNKNCVEENISKKNN